MASKRIKSSELKAGMLISYYGGLFRLRDDRKEWPPRIEGASNTITITGDWVGGAEMKGYFGPDKPWHFQGNDYAEWCLIIEH